MTFSPVYRGPKRGSDLRFGAEFLVRFGILCFLRTLKKCVRKGFLGTYGCTKSDFGLCYKGSDLGTGAEFLVRFGFLCFLRTS